MAKHLNIYILLFTTAFFALVGCKKESYEFGPITAPTSLTLTTQIQGVDASNPNGDGTGKVAITTTAKDALSYKIYFGDGDSAMVPTGVYTKKYTTPGLNTYTITVNAIGTGGAISTITKQITVQVNFDLPASIWQPLTNNGTSKVWVTQKEALGHFGVGPSGSFWPDWYAALPNTREACAYDDEITFSRDAVGRVFMNVDNKGASFSIGASTSFYGFTGGDGCYAINPGGNKQLAFMDATSGSTSASSTMIQFKVPGNGIINFGTGGVYYEILSISSTSMFLRNIGSDGNAWYQMLKPKP